MNLFDDLPHLQAMHIMCKTENDLSLTGAIYEALNSAYRQGQAHEREKQQNALSKRAEVAPEQQTARS